MSQDYELHITNYVMRNFRYLMTEAKRVADEAIEGRYGYRRSISL
jgi:hypothetical protein